MTKTRIVICPYCGETQPAAERCRACAGRFDPLSRRATHNAMGPWWLRDPRRPHHPGFSYETMVRLVERGEITKYSIIRGPTTKQFWTIAKRVAGVSHLLGYCHACDGRVEPSHHGCPRCGAVFGAYLERNYLGLPDVVPMTEDGNHVDMTDSAHGDEPRPSWRPPTLSPRGLSSFAPDDELLRRETRTGGGDRDERTPFAPMGPAETAPRTAESPVATAAEPRVGPASPGPAIGQAPSPEEWVTSPAVRAMQRRLAKQQRTIRILTVVIIVVALTGAIVNLAVLTMRSAGRAPSTGAPDRTAEPAPPGRTASEAGVGTAEDQSPPNAMEAAQPERADAAASPSAPSKGDSSPASSTSETSDPAKNATQPPIVIVEKEDVGASGYIAEYRRALALVDRADDESRPLADRLDDYSEALDVLRNVREQAPAEERPEKLDEIIERVERQIERLEIEVVLPGSGT
jgi:hypothetical protein